MCAQKRGSIWRTIGSLSRLHDSRDVTLHQVYEGVGGLCWHTLVWNDINMSHAQQEVPELSRCWVSMCGKVKKKREENINTPMLWESTWNRAHGGREALNPSKMRRDQSKRDSVFKCTGAVLRGQAGEKGQSERKKVNCGLLYKLLSTSTNSPSFISDISNKNSRVI